MEMIVVTRHKALYQYLVLKGIVPNGTPCMSHADVPDVRNKHVFGVLPYWLACKTALYTEVQMRIPMDKKGKELSLADLEFYSIKPRTYKVIELQDKKEKHNGRNEDIQLDS